MSEQAPVRDAPPSGVAAPPAALPAPPVEPVLDEDDPRTALQRRVHGALLALPGYFSSGSKISGSRATDLFHLGTMLGAGVEVEVVRTLNQLRDLWDPDGQWLPYRFERSSKAFPCVRLVRRDIGTPGIALGIELQSWFMLAKEGVPDVRYRVTPAACAPHDLVCVVPWHLSDTVAGTARVVEPWVANARYAALWRDHWWQFVRQTQDAPGIYHPPDASPYPAKAELVGAVPHDDGGHDFGSLARCQPLMDDFLDRTSRHELLGIAVRNWYLFLRVHSDTANADDVAGALQAQLYERLGPLNCATAQKVLALLDDLSALLRP